TLTNINTGASSSSVTPNGILSNNTLSTTTQFSVTVIDNNGCSAPSQNIIVNVTPQLLAVGMSSTACDKFNVVLSPNITSPGNGGNYSYNWSNGAQGSNNTVMANFANNPNTYSVIISDGCSPNATAFFTVNVNPVPTATFMSSYNKGCAPLAVSFQAIPTGSNSAGANYLWDFGGGSNGGGAVYTGPQTVMVYPNAGTYNVGLTSTNQFGCSSNFYVTNYVEVYPVPLADFIATPQTVTILEPTINFTNLSQGANSYVWDFGDYSSVFNSSSVMNPRHEYGLIGEYDVYMVAINSFGCKDTAKRRVIVEPDFSIYIPNAFTPDLNGRNDVFQPKGVGIYEDKYKMEIFDRWGELIFTSRAFSTGWDGTAKGGSEPCQDGVYIYKIAVVTLKGDKKYYVGHVTLLKQ
ncbi:MAG: gliding motility-associated C-terminal domain-containing protein, partial [Bacteroidetes bacterium]|nr:gliding motility-associated C-terminal domain-containing protein [Bacteroidota bacterium]